MHKLYSLLIAGIILLGLAPTTFASHTSNTPRGGIRGDVDSTVCVTRRSGSMRCRNQGVAAQVRFTNVDTGTITVVDTSRSGTFRAPLAEGTYQVKAFYNNEESPIHTIQVNERGYSRTNLFVPQDINFSFSN